jgi:hypothetical protein
LSTIDHTGLTALLPSETRLTDLAGREPGWKRQSRLAKIYVSVFAFIALAPLTASYVKWMLIGKWLVGRFGESSDHLFFLFHTMAGLAVFAALLLQYSLGFSAVKDGGSRAVLHRYLGRFLIIAFILFAAQGLYVEWRASIFDMHLHAVYASATLLILGGLCAYALISAWLNIRSGNVAEHMNDIVYFTIILSGIGFIRVYSALLMLCGQRNTDFYFGDQYLFSTSLIEWGTFFSVITLFVAVCLYNRQAGGRAGRRKLALTALFFCAWPLMVIGSHLNVPHRPAPEGSTRSVIRF